MEILKILSPAATIKIYQSLPVNETSRYYNAYYQLLLVTDNRYDSHTENGG